jgi:hypothetical protein
LHSSLHLPFFGIVSFAGFTSAACPSAFFDQLCIFWCKFVALLAMSLCGVTRFGNAGSETTHDIFFGSYCFQVIRVDAAGHSAKMVYNQAVRDLPLGQLVRNDCGPAQFPAFSAVIDVHICVTMTV